MVVGKMNLDDWPAMLHMRFLSRRQGTEAHLFLQSIRCWKDSRKANIGKSTLELYWGRTTCPDDCNSG